MKKALVIMFIGLLTMTGFASCSSTDEDEGKQENTVMGTFLDIPCEKVSSESLPEWLVTRVGSLDELTGMRIEVYQFEWNGSIWYFISNPLNSCMFCEIYDKSGNNADGQEEISKDELLRASTNWKFIFYR